MATRVLLIVGKKERKRGIKFHWEKNKAFVKELQSSFLNRYTIPADGICGKNCCILFGKRRYNFLQKLAWKPAYNPLRGRGIQYFYSEKSWVFICSHFFFTENWLQWIIHHLIPALANVKDRRNTHIGIHPCARARAHTHTHTTLLYL